MKSNLKIVNKTKSLNFKKIAQTRRQRGYNWEDTLVKRFNKMDDWKAFRLGSPSVALPDILCVNNIDSIIFTIEAKSGTGTTLTVPFDQIKTLTTSCSIRLFPTSALYSISLQNFRSKDFILSSSSSRLIAQL